MSSQTVTAESMPAPFRAKIVNQRLDDATALDLDFGKTISGVELEKLKADMRFKWYDLRWDYNVDSGVLTGWADNLALPKADSFEQAVQEGLAHWKEPYTDWNIPRKELPDTPGRFHVVRTDWNHMAIVELEKYDQRELDVAWRTLKGDGWLRWTPGKHTVRFAWAAAQSPDGDQPTKLISNPVEIEILRADADKAAWSKEVDGLQLGLGFDLQDRPYVAGETVRFKLLVRNNSAKAMTLIDFQPLMGWVPTVRGADGKRLFVNGEWDGQVRRREQVVAPGKTIVVGGVSLRLDAPWDGPSNDPPHILLQPGKYFVGQTYRFEEDPEATFSGELTSGELALTVSEDTPWGEAVEGVVEKWLALIREGNRDDAARLMARGKNENADDVLSMTVLLEAAAQRNVAAKATHMHPNVALVISKPLNEGRNAGQSFVFHMMRNTNWAPEWRITEVSLVRPDEIAAQLEAFHAKPVDRPVNARGFGPVLERTVRRTSKHTTALDLDANRLIRVPNDFDTNRNVTQDPIKWLVVRGIDVMPQCNPNRDTELSGLGGMLLKVRQVENTLWDESDAAQVRKLLAASKREMGMQLRASDGSYPVTYVFATFPQPTGESRQGVLQVLAVDQNEQAVKLRYQLVGALRNAEGVKAWPQDAVKAVFESLRSGLVEIGTDYPEFARARDLRVARRGAFYGMDYNHNCTVLQRGYRDDGPNAAYFRFEIYSLPKEGDPFPFATTPPAHRWPALNLAGWSNVYVGKNSSPGVEAKVRDILRRHVAMIDRIAESQEGKRQEDGWGEAVKGVMMRLHTGKSCWAQGRMPELRVDFVNISNDRIDRLALLNENWAIEVDGRLYRVAVPDPTPMTEPLALAPNTTQKDVLVPLHEELGWKDQRSELEFLPGKHTVRIHFTHDETVKANGKSAGIHLVSNPVVIEIVAAEYAKDTTAGEEEEAPAVELDGPATKMGTSGVGESAGRATGARDQLLGWYSLPDRHHETGKIIPRSGRLIPVLKYGTDYYSVAGPGWEVPLKQCPEGLEWGATPSSMDGTLIGFNEESDTVYLRIVDQQRAHIQDTFVSGEKRTLVKVKKPSKLLDATAPSPATLDDFVGWYAHLWAPQASRIQIGKDGRKYVAAVFLREGTTDKWNEHEKHELAPLPEGLGLAFGDNSGLSLNYNMDLRRFELSKGTESGVRIPLARIPAPVPGETVPALKSSSGRIGIPCWH